jgi:hypothetical protein
VKRLCSTLPASGISVRNRTDAIQLFRFDRSHNTAKLSQLRSMTSCSLNATFVRFYREMALRLEEAFRARPEQPVPPFWVRAAPSAQELYDLRWTGRFHNHSTTRNHAGANRRRLAGPTAHRCGQRRGHQGMARPIRAALASSAQAGRPAPRSGRALLRRASRRCTSTAETPTIEQLRRRDAAIRLRLDHSVERRAPPSRHGASQP